MTFGDLLREHRESRGYSQEHLAERARMSVTAIGALERGLRRAPYLATIDLLADALELSAAARAEFERAAARARARGDKSTPVAERRTNIPLASTSFIGRTADVAKLETLLERNRLVTITGMGGIGKTRIALELAAQTRNRDDIWFIDLTPVHGTSGIASKIAAIVQPRLPYRDGSVDGLAYALKSRKLLLLLDNCEHVIDAAAAIASAILERCPDVRILATSRERLGIFGEALHRLASLTVPGTVRLDDASEPQCEATALFVDRARFVDPSFTASRHQLVAVGDICRRLDGLPLAIELAVAHLPTLGLGMLQKRLKEGFVLGGGSPDLPARQRSMLATIAWSYDLLGETERLVLDRVAIFAAGNTLEAAEAVCSDERVAPSTIPDILASLVEKSLVNVVRTANAIRYTLLDSVRHHGLDRLSATGEAEVLARRHAKWFEAVADRADANYLKLPLDTALIEVWPDLDNVRAALEWAFASESPADVVIGGRIAVGLRALLIVPGRLIKCRDWVETALGRIDENRYPDVVVRLLRALIASTNGLVVPSVAERAIPLFERIGDRRGHASLHVYRAYTAARNGRLAEAGRAIELASSILIEERMQTLLAYASLTGVRALLRGAQGRFDEARADSERAEELAVTLEEYFATMLASRLFRAEVESAAGNIAPAAAILEDVLANQPASTANGIAALDVLASLAAFRLALRDSDDAEASARDVVERAGIDRPLTFEVLAAIRALRGQPESAARLRGFASAAVRRPRLVRMAVRQRTSDIARTALRDELTDEAYATLSAERARFSNDRALEELRDDATSNSSPSKIAAPEAVRGDGSRSCS